MSSTMTAKKLRIVLFVTILLILAAVIGGFVFARHSLNTYATQISQLNADANSGDESIRTLKALETRLNNEQDVQIAAQSIVADSNTFAEQVVNDVTRIAAQSGVTITSLEYVDTASSTGAATGAAPVAAAPAAPTAPGAATPGTTPATGTTKKSLSVSIESPVDYNKLMAFIRNIESNQLKLQIASVSLTKDDGNKVGTQTFSIGANVR